MNANQSYVLQSYTQYYAFFSLKKARMTQKKICVVYGDDTVNERNAESGLSGSTLEILISTMHAQNDRSRLIMKSKHCNRGFVREWHGLAAGIQGSGGGSGS